MTSTCLVLLGAFPTFFLLDRLFLTWRGTFNIDLSYLFYPPLWGSFVLVAIIGALAAYPFHLWMIQRGAIRWGEVAMPGEESARGLNWIQQTGLLIVAAALITLIMILANLMVK